MFALWDARTVNLVASFDNRRVALALVLSGIERNGPHDTETLALDLEDEHSEVTPIAHGQALAELARQEFSARATR